MWTNFETMILSERSQSPIGKYYMIPFMSIYCMSPKQATPERQKVDCWLLGVGEKWGRERGLLMGMGFLSGLIKNTPESDSAV